MRNRIGYQAPHRPSDDAMADYKGPDREARSRCQSVFAKELIPGLRVALEKAPPETVCSFAEEAIDLREAGVPDAVTHQLLESVHDTLSRMPARELAIRLGSMIDTLAVEVKRPKGR